VAHRPARRPWSERRRSKEKRTIGNAGVTPSARSARTSDDEAAEPLDDEVLIGSVVVEAPLRRRRLGIDTREEALDGAHERLEGGGIDLEIDAPGAHAGAGVMNPHLVLARRRRRQAVVGDGPSLDEGRQAPETAHRRLEVGDLLQARTEHLRAGQSRQARQLGRPGSATENGDVAVEHAAGEIDAHAILVLDERDGTGVLEDLSTAGAGRIGESRQDPVSAKDAGGGLEDGSAADVEVWETLGEGRSTDGFRARPRRSHGGGQLLDPLAERQQPGRLKEGLSRFVAQLLPTGEAAHRHLDIERVVVTEAENT
jgi:hypothetical protein